MTNEKAEKVLENEITVAQSMLEQNTIACEYCGQVLINGECNCPEACKARRKEKMINDAIINTLPMLTDEESCEKFNFKPINNEELLNALKSIIKNVGNELIEKATLKVDENTTFTIQNKDIYIEISRKENKSKVVKLGG